MSKVRNVNVRFNLSRDVHRKAWEYLRTMDRKRFRSYSQVIAVAVVEYFERLRRFQENPDFEQREVEEYIVSRVLASVESGVEKSLPKALARTLLRLLRVWSSTAVSNDPVDDETEREDSPGDPPDEMIDWDFLGR